ncbi:uncharacterized protein LOC133852629 [Alnus glutinosa]|uniref:uncharacterized protein LOC133852629 n=1 Tax=Alnus glutinosa TaxID=3517 RepID=UPI002D7A288D|nr:uncharacterized protein LOC133852629 [Alnus glutinosa]
MGNVVEREEQSRAEQSRPAVCCFFLHDFFDWFGCALFKLSSYSFCHLLYTLILLFIFIILTTFAALHTTQRPKTENLVILPSPLHCLASLPPSDLGLLTIFALLCSALLFTRVRGVEESLPIPILILDDSGHLRIQMSPCITDEPRTISFKQDSIRVTMIQP